MKVFFFIVLYLSGQQPVLHHEEVADRQVCMAMVADAMKMPAPANGAIDIGCKTIDAATKS